MRPIWIYTSPCRIQFGQAYLRRAGDINMYGFSMPDAMTKPKNSEKNNEGSDRHSGRP